MGALAKMKGDGRGSGQEGASPGAGQPRGAELRLQLVVLASGSVTKLSPRKEERFASAARRGRREDQSEQVK